MPALHNIGILHLSAVIRVVFLALTFSPIAVDAALISLGSYNSGHYTRQGSGQAAHTPAPINEVYITGINSYGDNRSYFVFDLSSVFGGLVTSASLRFNPGYYFSPDSFERLGLFNVSTSIESLMEGISMSEIGFERWLDLGTGVRLGGGDVLKFSGATDSYVEFEFDAQGIKYINDFLESGRQLIAFGGALESLSQVPGFGAREAIFASLFGWPLTESIRLEIEVQKVPEPPALLLALQSLLLLLVVQLNARRQRRV
jgi:hypothetical protein